MSYKDPLSVKARRLLKFMYGYSVGNTKCIAEDMNWSPRSTGLVLSHLEKKGLVKRASMKYIRAITWSPWSLTEEGKMVFHVPTADELYEAVNEGRLEELKDCGIHDPQEHNLKMTVHLIFVYRALKRKFPYITVETFHEAMRPGWDNFQNWDGYRFHLSPGLIVSNIIGLPSVTFNEHKAICTTRFRFLNMWKRDEK